MKRSILTFFGSILLLSGWSQSTLIKGKAVSYEGKKVTAYVYDDYISFRERELGDAVVDEEGNFDLTFNVSGIQHVTLKLDRQKASMYCEAGKTYTVRFHPKDSTRYVNENVEIETDLSFLISDTTELNALIMDYNIQFDKFWLENYQYFVKKRARHKIDTFRMDLETRYAHIQNPYFNTFLDYSIASLKESVFESRKKLAKQYLVGQEVQHDNYEYMQFFNTYFKFYLRKLTTNNDTLDQLVNLRPNYLLLKEELKKDELLQDDVLCDLLLIKGLYELYFVTGYNQANIFNLLEAIALKSDVREHRKIANNLLSSFSQLKDGSKAPYFEGLTENGDTLKSTHFENQYIYLNFWRHDCTPCLSELKVMAELNKTYGKKIKFISIALDPDPTAMWKYINANKKDYNWLFLTAADEEALKKTFELRSTPFFYLINDRGRFEQAPADMPSQNIERRLFKITRPKRQFKVGQ